MPHLTHACTHTYVHASGQEATVQMKLDMKQKSVRSDQIGGRKAVGCEVHVWVCSLLEVAQGSA